jgi:hypothetical protein
MFAVLEGSFRVCFVVVDIEVQRLPQDILENLSALSKKLFLLS